MEEYQMNEDQVKINWIDNVKYEKAILNELVKKFPKRYEQYYEIIRTHPQFLDSLDAQELPVDDRIHILYSDILVDLEISFAKFKIQDVKGSLNLLRQIKYQFAALEKALNELNESQQQNT